MKSVTSIPSDIERKEERGLNSYKNIIKGSSFFGGVQIFNIVITLIRGKFVAIILGPEGMGISSLFNTACNTIQRVAGLGLSQSIIRDVATQKDQPVEKEKTVWTSLVLSHLAGLLGLIICIAFCVPLSRVTFGDVSFWWQFIILGAGVGFGIAGGGLLAILQGLHEVKRISKASVIGGLTGLGIGIPLYYIWGYKGIVISISAVFLSLYIFYFISFRKSYRLSSHDFEWKKYIPIAKNLLSLGLVLMSGDLLTTLVGYLINLFVRIFGSIDDVGLYQAANSITYQFAGMIFAALAMDYFPRLSAVASDNEKLKTAVNRQSEIVSWLTAPAMALLILSTPLLIRVLLAESFHSIIPLMRWMGLGMLFRAFSFPMAYITFAKGNKTVFFILEGIVANTMTLVFSCLFFHWFGLIGLGYALVADNAFCFVLYYIVNRCLYKYDFSKTSILNFIIGGMLAGGCFVFSFLSSQALSYTLMGLSAAIALLWGFFSLKVHYKS